MLKNIYLIIYKLMPLPENESFDSVGGAYANCFVQAASSEQAKKIATLTFLVNHWQVLNIEEEPEIVLRENHLEDNNMLINYDEANSNGECYTFHVWPDEPHDENEVN